MRVTFEHREKNMPKGTFSSKTVRQVEVLTTVQFSEVELAVITGWELEYMKLFERKYDALTRGKSQEKNDTPNRMTIKDLLQREPDRFTFDTPSQAKTYQRELTEALKLLKLTIDADAALGEPTTFEL